MPVVLDDEMLIPPSLRRKHYVNPDRVYEVSNSTSSVIELPSHTRVVERTPLHYEPAIVHQETYISRPSDIEVVREKEYIANLSGGRGQRYHRGREPHAEYSRRRAQSVGYGSYDDSCSSCDETSYTDDNKSSTSFGRRIGSGSTYGEERRIARHRSSHRRGDHGVGAIHDAHRRGDHGVGAIHDAHRHVSSSSSVTGHTVARSIAEVAGAGVAAGLAGAAVHRLRRRSSSASSTSSKDGEHHRVRNAAVAGLAAVGARKLYERRHDHQEHDRQSHRRYSNESTDSHHRGRHLAELGLGAAAAGAAKRYYSRHRSRNRSPSTHRSQESDNHTGRHLAAAAVGATAAGLAAHRHAQNRAQHEQYSHEDEQNHRGRKVVAGVATATAAGLAAKHYHDHHNRSRSTSSSSTSSGGRSHHRVRSMAAAVGPTELARKYQQHRQARSHSRPGILRRRSRSASSSSDDGKQHHKARNAALGLGALGAAGAAGLSHRHHQRKKSRSRSRSRPGILRRRSSSVSSSSDDGRGYRSHESGRYHHQRSPSPASTRPGMHRRRSKSVSLPHNRSSSRGANLARNAMARMSGALPIHNDEQRRRSRSVDGEGGRRRSRSAASSRSGYEDNGTAGMIGRLVGEAVKGAAGGRKSRFHGHGGAKQGLAHGMAYKLGESVAESMQRRRAGY